MSGEISAAFKELVDRLKASNVAGKLLEQVTLVEGPTLRQYEKTDLPVIQYELMDVGRGDDAGFPDCTRTSMVILFTVMTADECGYYNDEKTGMLDFYEKLQTVIDGEDTLDLAGAGKWGETSPQYEIGGFEASDLCNQYLVEVTIQTKRYQRGSLA